MKSKGLFGKKYLDIQQREAEIATPDEDHVIIKVHACGVCGTDVNFARDWPEDHMPLGHEIAAEVIEVGQDVTALKPGDKVIVEDCTMCGVCTDCKTGHVEFCRNMYDMEEQPGMGEYMSVRFNSLDRFEGLDYVSAALTEPLAVCVTAVLNAEIPLGGSVVVLGPGPLGLMSAKLAKLKGAGFVAITGLPADNEREKARLDLAKELGCDLTIDERRRAACGLEPRSLHGVPFGRDASVVQNGKARQDHFVQIPLDGCFPARFRKPSAAELKFVPDDRRNRCLPLMAVEATQ